MNDFAYRMGLATSRQQEKQAILGPLLAGGAVAAPIIYAGNKAKPYVQEGLAKLRSMWPGSAQPQQTSLAGMLPSWVNKENAPALVTAGTAGALLLYQLLKSKKKAPVEEPPLADRFQVVQNRLLRF